MSCPISMPLNKLRPSFLDRLSACNIQRVSEDNQIIPPLGDIDHPIAVFDLELRYLSDGSTAKVCQRVFSAASALFRIVLSLFDIKLRLFTPFLARYRSH